MMMINALVVLAGVVCGPWLQSAQSQLVRATLEDECYNVGSCTPLQEPQGDQSEICKIFEESLACMKRSMEACRQLDFPPETVHQALHGVRLLREELQTYCSSGQQHKKQAGTGTGAPGMGAQGMEQADPGSLVRGSRGGSSEPSGFEGFVDWEIDGGEIEEMKAAEHSGQFQSQFTSSGSGGLPFPAIGIGATLLASLAVTWMLNYNNNAWGGIINAGL